MFDRFHNPKPGDRECVPEVSSEPCCELCDAAEPCAECVALEARPMMYGTDATDLPGDPKCTCTAHPVHICDNCTTKDSPVPAHTKPSNPKDAFGVMKVAYSVIPTPVLAEIGVGMMEGALKYGAHNYRVIGVKASIYYDAVVARHLAAWWEGEDTDPDSGLSHITKAITSLVVLRDAMIQGTWVDDRPPQSPAGWLAELNSKVAALKEKYPDPVAKYLAHGERSPGRRLEDA